MLLLVFVACMSALWMVPVDTFHALCFEPYEGFSMFRRAVQYKADWLMVVLARSLLLFLPVQGALLLTMRIFFDNEPRYSVRDPRNRSGGELGKAIGRWRDAALGSYLSLPFLFFELLYSEEIERVCGMDPSVNVVALPVVLGIVSLSLVFLFEAPYLGGGWFATHRDQAERYNVQSELEVARQVMLDLEGQTGVIASPKRNSMQDDSSSSATASGHSARDSGEWKGKKEQDKCVPDVGKELCDGSYLENLVLKAEMVTFLVFGCGALFAPKAMIDLLTTYDVIHSPLIFYQKLFGVGCLSIAASCWQIDSIEGTRPIFERRIHALSLLVVILLCALFSAMGVVHDVAVLEGYFLVPLSLAAFAVVLIRCQLLAV